MTNREAQMILDTLILEDKVEGDMAKAVLMGVKALEEPTLTTAGEPIFVTGMSIAKGKWSHPKRIHNVKHSTVWQCSICRRTCHCIGGVPRGEANICTYKFCPNCGAEMEKTDDKK